MPNLLWRPRNFSSRPITQRMIQQREKTANPSPLQWTNPERSLLCWTTTPNTFESPQVQQVIAENALGHAVPTAPTFYYNGINDELIWIKPLDQLVAHYCAGGASIEQVRLMKKHGEGLLIKASGGIRDLPTATAMLEAGAHRLGMSASVAVMEVVEPGGV